MFMQARRQGVDLLIAPDPTEFVGLLAAADVVQVHYWNHPALTDLLRTFELPEARVILVSRVLGTALPQILTAELGRFGDRLIVTSQLSFATEGYQAALASQIPVDFVPGVSDFRRLEGFTPQRHQGFVVGYLGSTNEAKMHPRLPEMYAEVSDPRVRFLICGGGGGEEDLLRRFAELGIADRVEVRGHVEDIGSAFADMDLFGYPLAVDTYATSDRVLQEAMWAGVPPVVLAGGGPADMVQDGVTGLVASSEEDFSTAIDRLAADSDLTAELGQAARAYARTAFDPKRWTGTMRQIVAELCGDARRKRARIASSQGAAHGFVLSLGQAAGPFGESLSAATQAQAFAADWLIATSPKIVAKGEGGVVHHRNFYPEDPHLRLWAGLIADGEGARDLAVAEYQAAKTLGFPDSRPDYYTNSARSR